MYEEYSPGEILQGSQWTSVNIWAAVGTHGVCVWVGGSQNVLALDRAEEVASDC